MVQVSTDANASPTITAFTTQSAIRNMPQADRSCAPSPDASTMECGPAAESVARNIVIVLCRQPFWVNTHLGGSAVARVIYRRSVHPDEVATPNQPLRPYRFGYRTHKYARPGVPRCAMMPPPRSEEHTSELQSRGHLVCR